MNQFILVQLYGYDEPSLMNVNHITHVGVAEGKTFIYFNATDRIYSLDSLENIKNKISEISQGGVRMEWASKEW